MSLAAAFSSLSSSGWSRLTAAGTDLTACAARAAPRSVGLGAADLQQGGAVAEFDLEASDLGQP